MNNVEQPLSPVQLADDLPAPNTKRWVVRRKAAVVAAVRVGRITMQQALRRYQLNIANKVQWSLLSRARAMKQLSSRMVPIFYRHRTGVSKILLKAGKGVTERALPSGEERVRMPLIELTVRRRVEQYNNITIREHCRVQDLASSPDGCPRTGS